MSDEQSTRFDRIPQTDTGSETPSRRDILAWWEGRYGISSTVFDRYSFWERGRGKLWCVSGTVPDPAYVEALGLFCLRTRGRHWKPTTNVAQRFGAFATRNVIELSWPAASRFVAGHDQELDWDGDWGYLFVSTAVAGEQAILGVGLFIEGELRSVVPKGRQRELIGGP